MFFQKQALQSHELVVKPVQWLLHMAQTSKEARLSPAGGKAISAMRSGRSFLEWCEKIPWKRGETPLAMTPAYEDAAFKLHFENNDYTDFWRQPGLAMDEYFESFPDMPILWVVGWYGAMRGATTAAAPRITRKIMDR